MLRKATAAFLGFTALAFLFALPTLQQPAAFWLNLRSGLANWWTWGLVSLLLLRLDRRLPVPEPNIGLRLLCHLPLSFLFSIIVLLLRTALAVALGWTPSSRLTPPELLSAILQPMFLWTWIIYWLILAAILAARYHQRFLLSELRAERLERLSTQATLHSLRHQLDPHFLFNALNTISAQVDSEPRLARRMIEHLGDLLRHSIETKDRLDIPLSEELATLDHYLAIQRIRFGDRLRFILDIAPHAQHAIVPALILQPLVENAIRHGLSRRSSGGSVWLTARLLPTGLLLSVEDDGDGLPPHWRLDTGQGVGLSLTQQRLAASYGATASLTVQPRPSGGASVQIHLPVLLSQGPLA